MITGGISAHRLIHQAGNIRRINHSKTPFHTQKERLMRAFVSLASYAGLALASRLPLATIRLFEPK